MCKKEAPIYWINIAISPTGKAAALVDREGFIWGGTPDFKVKGIRREKHVYVCVRKRNGGLYESLTCIMVNVLVYMLKKLQCLCSLVTSEDIVTIVKC